ncbi:MAG: GNAT family N-acetyltransferase [Chloroflexi bacterium]|nr:GNAT family N-acetyltransferase [Chloroflexota bacterium]
MELLIREVRLEDAAAIVRILNPIIEAGVYTVMDTPLTVEFERQYIAHFPRRGVFHVAEFQPEPWIVGCQSLEPLASYTHAFDHVGVMGTYVDLAERRRGIGTRLFAATVAAARRHGYEKIFTYVRADNLASLAFHLKLGFRLVGTAQRQARLHGQYLDEILIEKFLADS